MEFFDKIDIVSGSNIIRKVLKWGCWGNGVRGSAPCSV